MIYISKKLKSKLSELSEESNMEIGFALLSDKDDEINRIVCIDNQSKSDMRFTSDNNQLLDIDKYSKDNGYNVIGFFHSHIYTRPIPSREDMDMMKLTNQIWLIYSKFNQKMLCFEWTDKLESVELKS